MNTLTEQTASIQAINEQLERLDSRVRTLWSGTLTVTSEEEEELITALTDVDVALERISLRSACNLLEPADQFELARCQHRIANLELEWDLTAERFEALCA